MGEHQVPAAPGALVCRGGWGLALSLWVAFAGAPGGWGRWMQEALALPWAVASCLT